MKSLSVFAFCLFWLANSLMASGALEECHVRGGLPNVLSKLKQGGEVRIAYLGGSITAQDGWRPKTLRWFQEQFPKSSVKEVYAAIGGTGSDLGVFRLSRDVLDHKPDLLFVEFAVNDGGASVEQIHRCMEGIVRQTWRQDPTTDICFVYTVANDMLNDLKAERLPRSVGAMETLADHYGIPSINMGLEVARLEKAGLLVFKGEQPKNDAEKQALGDKILFSPDSVHPYTESGHVVYLQAVARGITAMREMTNGMTGAHVLKEPLRADNWEKAKMIPLSRIVRKGTWLQLDGKTNSLAQSFLQFIPELWLAQSPGESLQFRFKGSVARLYDLMGPDAGQLSVRVDDKPVQAVRRFDAYCTYHRLASFTAVEDSQESVHTVQIGVMPDVLDKAKILSERHEKMDEPKRFEGVNWYAGAVLLVGDLSE